MTKRGNIILLNGVSSSGKSTLATAFIKLRPDYFHVCADDYANWINSMENQQSRRIIPVETEHYFHRTVAMFSDTGVNVIVDSLMHDAYTVKDCCATLKEYPVLCVGVYCSADELIRREQARGDRHPGQAVRQLDFVHRDLTYDLQFDTQVESAEHCAQIINSTLLQGDHPAAWLTCCEKWFGAHLGS